MSSPRVLLVSQQVRSVRSGVGTYARILIDELAARGLGLAVATWHDECAPGELGGIDWIDLGSRPRLDPTPGCFWTLGRRVAALDLPAYDIVHFLDAREAHAFGRGHHGAVAGTVHDDYAARCGRSPFALTGKAADPIRRWLYYRWLARLERLTYARLDALMYNSLATRETVERRYGTTTPGSVVPLCVGPEPEPEALDLCGRPALLFAGGNFYRKGLDVIARSMSLLDDRLPGAVLHVAGDDPARRRITGLAEAGRIVFHGRVPPRRLAAMFGAADVFVMPSRYEALGLVYLEAFRSRLPVVAGNVGGVTDLVADQSTGLAVEPENEAALADAIVRLSRDTDLRQRVIAGGLGVLAERTPERLVEATLAAYETVATGRGSAGTQSSPEATASSPSSARPIASGENVCS